MYEVDNVSEAVSDALVVSFIDVECDSVGSSVEVILRSRESDADTLHEKVGVVEFVSEAEISFVVENDGVREFVN